MRLVDVFLAVLAVKVQKKTKQKGFIVGGLCSVQVQLCDVTANVLT